MGAGCGEKDDALPNSSHLHCWNLVNTLLCFFCQRKGTLEHILSCCPKFYNTGGSTKCERPLERALVVPSLAVKGESPQSRPLAQSELQGRKGEHPKQHQAYPTLHWTWNWQLTQFTVPWHITEDVSLLSIGKCFISAGLKQNFHNFCCDHRQICLFSCITHIYTSLINKVEALMSNYSSKD